MYIYFSFTVFPVALAEIMALCAVQCFDSVERRESKYALFDSMNLA